MSQENFTEVVKAEHNWLECAMKAIKKDELEKEERILWSAYHIYSSKVEVTSTRLLQLMPLFYGDCAALVRLLPTAGITCTISAFIPHLVQQLEKSS